LLLITYIISVKLTNNFFIINKDRIFEVIGEYDKYQINISILMSITEPFFTIYSLICTFFTKVPDFKCISKNNKDLCLQSNYTFIKNQQGSLDNWANTKKNILQ